MDIAQLAERTAAGADLGQPGARKSGRDPRWPYVPLVQYTGTVVSPKPFVSQIPRRAFATRAQALAYAYDHIERHRAELARKLADPRYGALRQQYGLPRELGS